MQGEIPKAKDESSLFAHQIAKWFELEESVEEVETKVELNSKFCFKTQYRELLLIQSSNHLISLFPVYRQIMNKWI